MLQFQGKKNKKILQWSHFHYWGLQPNICSELIYHKLVHKKSILFSLPPSHPPIYEMVTDYSKITHKQWITSHLSTPQIENKQDLTIYHSSYVPTSQTLKFQQTLSCRWPLNSVSRSLILSTGPTQQQRMMSQDLSWRMGSLFPSCNFHSFSLPKLNDSWFSFIFTSTQ